MTKGIHLQQWKDGLARSKVLKQKLRAQEIKTRQHVWAYLASHLVTRFNSTTSYVSAEIQHQFIEHGTTRFWLMSFKHADTAAVSEALRFLAEHGALKERASVLFDGSVQWSGQREDVNDELLHSLWNSYVDILDDGEEIDFEDAREDLIDIAYDYELAVKPEEPPE